MGNKQEKIINNNINRNDNQVINKLDELIKDYLISEKGKKPRIEKLLSQFYSNKTKKNFEKSKLEKNINSKNFIDFSLLLANQIQIKALNKDLNFNFEKNFLLNSHAIQLCSVEDVNNNILFDNKSALLQMNSYDKRFNEEFEDKFIKKEVIRFDSMKKKVKDELQFEKDMDEEIKNLQSKNKKSFKISFNFYR